jgi:tRNA nucleotidyltransferase (CCA-adding enzyme)
MSQTSAEGNADRPSDLLLEVGRRLPQAEKELLEAALSLAARKELALYLVGGSVRDLLLGRPHFDLDLAVEGDAVALAEELAEAWGRVVAHAGFGTASIKGDSFRLDLARTRAESYSRPGALPTVRPAAIDADLGRRDFTVNAMALRLTSPGAGELLDPHDGRRDLERQVIRVLHDSSFRDDATRMLRAVRYDGRLGFRLDDNTERLLRRDLPYLDAISGARLRRELLALFREERPRDLLRRCQELGVLAAIHPCLRLDEAGDDALLRAEDERPAPWDELCFCLLGWGREEGEVESLVERLALPKRYERALLDTARLTALLPALSEPGVAPSRVVAMLEPLSASAVRALSLRTTEGAAAERAGRFLREWRQVRPFLSGRSLRRLGLRQGPELGDLLRRLRSARLDGLTRSREDELALIRGRRR